MKTVGRVNLIALAVCLPCGVAVLGAEAAPPWASAAAAETQQPVLKRIATLASVDPHGPVVVEIESLTVTAVASAGPFVVQPMAGFGAGWGGDAQLFWPAPAPAGEGPRLAVAFDLPRAGRYELVLFHTVAPDYGRYTLFLDGRLSSDVDGYHPSVALSRSVLGPHDLAAGRHELALRVTGKNDSSTDYFVGLDRLEATPVPAAPTAAPPPSGPATSRLPADAPPPSTTFTILPSLVANPALVAQLADRPRLEARHTIVKCCFRTEEDFDTRRVLLDWSSPNLEVTLRWRPASGLVAQGRWEVHAAPPVDERRFDPPLANGLVPVPAAGEWQTFRVDLAPLAPGSGKSLPSFLGGTRAAAERIRRRLFLHVVPLDAGGQPVGNASNILLFAFDGETGPGKLKAPPGPAPSLAVARYDPVHPYTRDFLCWLVAPSDGPPWPLSNPPQPSYLKGQAMYICNRRSGSILEDFAGAFVKGIASLVSGVGNLIDGVSVLYSEVKSAAVDVVAGAFAQVGCGDPCRLAVELALDAALASAGVPPSLPNFDRALADLEQGGIDAVTKIVADAAVSQGLPGPVAEEAARQAVSHLVHESKKAVAAATSGGSGPQASGWKHDPARAYRPGRFVLEVRNTSDRPTAETVLRLSQNDPRKVAVPDIPVSGGLFKGTETVDVGGLRTVFRKIPPLAPGTSLRVELPLEPIPDPHRWLELYYDRPAKLSQAAAAACGQRPPGTCSFNQQDTESCAFAQCMNFYGNSGIKANAAAMWLNSAFADVYGPGNENFTLSLGSDKGKMTINTSQGVAFVRYMNPTWQGQRVDACLSATQQCGEPAAQRFCKMMGYLMAVGAQGATDLGPQSTTVTLDEKKTCTGAHCAAFSEITCSWSGMPAPFRAFRDVIPGLIGKVP